MTNGAVRLRAVAAGLPATELVVGPDQAGARIEWRDAGHAILAQESPVEPGSVSIRTRLLIGPVHRRVADGVQVREVVVDGWRIEVEFESADRAALRDRAGRAAGRVGTSGPVEIRAELPGRIVRLLVAPGEAVVAGQQLLVIEAMKMLNELRAPRAGVVERLGVAEGDGVDLGNLLVVLR